MESQLSAERSPTESAQGSGERATSERAAVEQDDIEPDTMEPSTGSTVTFTQDIAPLIVAHCAPCHRNGQGAPFSLLSYEDVAERAEQIADVTQRRYMPPWLPEDGPHKLAFDRRLSAAELQLIQSWVAAGTPRGAGADLPPQTPFQDGWQLGPPDLVVQMPTGFEIPAEGLDLYRNFVISIPLDCPRWVRAMELRPDNPRGVHHAFMLIDQAGECRRLDAADEQPGFAGMEAAGAESPEGHFISWQPGKVASSAPAGMAWQLTPGTDLVLQMHLQPTGKREVVRASVGFYFTDEPPTRFPVKLVLRSTDLDIPAGEGNYVIETRYVLPTDVRVIGIIPHAHYLGKRLEALATLPDGRTEVLLRIPAWDFNWQGDYRFAAPPRLPQGTTLIQRFSYDNSAANVRNPNAPPQRVRYGLQSVDEMAELWLQVEPLSDAGRQTLLQDFGRRSLLEIAARSRRMLQEAPTDLKALVELGKATLALESPAMALPILRRATTAHPESLDAQYYLGHALLRSGDLTAARVQLNQVRKRDDSYQMAWHDLGLIYLQSGRLPQAEALFRKSLQLSPYHGTSLSNLGLVLLQQNQLAEGIELLERAQQVRPTDTRLRDLLQQARRAAAAE